MEVQCFTGGNFAQNGYVAWCEVTGQCVIVDPGAAALDMVAAVKAGAGDLTAVLLTRHQIDGNGLGDNPLQVHRDAYPKGRGGTVRSA